MTGVDWIIIGIVFMLALIGWAQGFVSGSFAFAGLIAGVWIGTRIGPLLIPEGARSVWAPSFGLLGALIAGAVMAGLFEAVGSPLRRLLRAIPGFSAADGLLGALLIACAGLGTIWILGVMAVHNGNFMLRTEVQRSAILQRLNTVMPPSGPLLNSLRRLDPFPRIDGNAGDVERPTAAIARDPEVREASASVVRVLGTACGLGVSGSGWVAGNGLIVTNAHVVAGERDTTVLARGREPGLPAETVHFDPSNDVAILRVAGLDAPTLRFATRIERGTSGAILGFPLNGPFDIRAARVGDSNEVLSPDAYGRGPIRRQMTTVRGLVRPGNSGGPVVDGQGRVLTTVFAATTSGPRGGYGVPNEIVQRAIAQSDSPVSTGPCAG